MLKFFRLKAMLFASLIQPVLWLTIFGLAMSDYFTSNMPAMITPLGATTVNYITFMAPGILAMTILFTCLYSGIFLQLDKQFGMLKQILASPMKRPQLLVGLTLSGTTKSLLQAIIIIAFGFLLGVELFIGQTIPHAIINILGILLLVVLLSIGLMFLSLTISLKIESHEGVQAVITLLTLPLFFASNALYPLASLPLALRAIAYINPITYFINGARYFGIGTDFYSFGTHYTFTTNDLLISIAALIIFDIIMYLLAARTFKNARVT